MRRCGRSYPLNRAAADLLLPYGDIHSLLVAFDLAQEAIEIAHQNIIPIAVPNVSIVLLAIIFALDPTLAVISDRAANLLVELNSLRPLWGDRVDVNR
jgi:cation transport ATPase